MMGMIKEPLEVDFSTLPNKHWSKKDLAAFSKLIKKLKSKNKKQGPGKARKKPVED